MDAARSRLVHLAGLAETTASTERQILAAAEDRLKAVSADIDRLRPRVHLDPAASDAYRAAVQERGQVTTVIAQARRVLGS